MRCFVLLATMLVTVPVSAAPGRGLSELEQREAISIAAQRAFLQGDFAQLERTSSRYRVEQSRTSSGLWKLTLFYSGIDKALDIPSAGRPSAAFMALEPRVRKWQQQHPDSPTPHIAMSMLHINHAWGYRGNGLADTVAAESWPPFEQHVESARQTLEAHKGHAASDPRWYETMLIVARLQHWERDSFDRLLEEALQREPYFYQTYFAALQYLLPKWHGEVSDIEAFARQAVARTSQLEGEGLYARIYWHASQAQFRDRLFERSLVFWPRMNKGFEDVIKQYPDAWNLNNYARFACLVEDRPKTRELLERVQSEMLPEVWKRDSEWKVCWEWSHHKSSEQP